MKQMSATLIQSSLVMPNVGAKRRSGRLDLVNFLDSFDF